MKKPFLLTAGDQYYPCSGCSDWIACYETYEDAKSQVKIIEFHTFYQKGVNKGEIKETVTSYEINGKKFDWYVIVDLRYWAE